MSETQKAIRKLQQFVFQVDPDFMTAVNVEIARRRSTLRKEATLALSARLGIDVPAPFSDEDGANASESEESSS